MKTEFRSSFNKDLQAIRNQTVRNRVARLIESVEKAKDLSAIPGLKKLHGDSQAFRARVGEYRVGLKVEGDGLLGAWTARRFTGISRKCASPDRCFEV